MRRIAGQIFCGLLIAFLFGNLAVVICESAVSQFKKWKVKYTRWSDKKKREAKRRQKKREEELAKDYSLRLVRLKPHPDLLNQFKRQHTNA